MTRPSSSQSSPHHLEVFEGSRHAIDLSASTERLLNFADRLETDGVPFLAATVRRAAATPARLPVRTLQG
ncbi:MAG: hypothetical protein AAGI52_02410 [Bacteroidota bacterium]